MGLIASALVEVLSVVTVPALAAELTVPYLLRSPLGCSDTAALSVCGPSFGLAVLHEPPRNVVATHASSQDGCRSTHNLSCTRLPSSVGMMTNEMTATGIGRVTCLP